MNVSTAGSIGDELPTTPHPQEEAYPSGTGSSNGKSNAATMDFLKAMFSKNNFTKEDIAKKAPAVTSLIPARNSPRKIETREVGLIMCCVSRDKMLILRLLDLVWKC